MIRHQPAQRKSCSEAIFERKIRKIGQSVWISARLNDGMGFVL
jgi:hypothetical protein